MMSEVDPPKVLPGGGLFRTVGQLYVVQFAGYGLPLLTVPYLARHLGAEGVGVVATFQALANYFTTLNEYGFGISATRDAARIKNDRPALSELVGAVLGAKLLLGFVCGVLMLVLSYFLPSLQHRNILLASALLYTFGQSLSAMWLYQARNRITFAATCDFTGRVVGVVVLFIFVKVSQDAWLALALPGAAILASAFFSIVIAYRDLPFSIPSITSILSVIRGGHTIFVSRCVGTLMSSGNALILSIFAPPIAVGYYSGGERIYRAGIGGMYPFSQVMFPRIAHLVAHDKDRARSEVVRSLSIMLCAALCLSGTLLGLGRYLVVFLLGPAFEPSIPVLSIFAIIPVFRAITDVLGLQWMISHGLDREFTICLAIAGLIGTGLAFLLSKGWAQNGAAVSVVASEFVLAVSVLFCVGFKGITPFLNTRDLMRFGKVVPSAGN